MTRRVYWGIATLIVLLIGVSVFLLMRNTDTEPEKVYRDVEPSKEVMDQIRVQTLKSNPPPAEAGYKWVWHHNHWDKVPINNTKTPVLKTEKQRTATSAHPFTMINGKKVWEPSALATHRYANDLYKVPVDLSDFEATKAAMIKYTNYVQANWNPRSVWDPKAITLEVSEALTHLSGIYNYSRSKMLCYYTPKQREEIRTLYFSFKEAFDLRMLKALENNKRGE